LPFPRAKAKLAKDFTNKRAYRGRPLTEADRETNRRKSAVRSYVEHAFGIIKGQFGFRKVRYRGIAKNLNKLNVLAALANLVICKKKLLKLVPAYLRAPRHAVAVRALPSAGRRRHLWHLEWCGVVHPRSLPHGRTERAGTGDGRLLMLFARFVAPHFKYGTEPVDLVLMEWEKALALHEAVVRGQATPFWIADFSRRSESGCVDDRRNVAATMAKAKTSVKKTRGATP